MKSNRGFTLIELMIVVVIIAILAGIAYPSYDEYVKRGNRTEGQALLSEAAATQERYFSQNKLISLPKPTSASCICATHRAPQ
nr:type IV pilin protein [Pseudomonas aeruginosa]